MNTAIPTAAPASSDTPPPKRAHWRTWRRRVGRLVGYSALFVGGVFAPWLMAACVGYRAPDDQSWREIDLPERLDDPDEHRDIVFTHPAGSDPLKLDLFLPPASAPRPLPTIVGFFGGGFTSGHRGMYHGFARDMARLGYAVVTPDYRLMSAAPWPGCLNDAKAAVAWVRKHAGEYGLDAGRIAAMGRSSGGYLAMMLATTAREDASLAGPPQPVVRAAISEAGPTDLAPVLWDGTLQGRFLSGFFGENGLDRTSPAHRVTDWTAPILMFHGCIDGTVQFSQSYVMRLQMENARRPVRLVALPGTGHDPLNVHWQRGQHEIHAWLQQHLAPASAADAE